MFKTKSQRCFQPLAFAPSGDKNATFSRTDAFSFSDVGQFWTEFFNYKRKTSPPASRMQRGIVSYRTHRSLRLAARLCAAEHSRRLHRPALRAMSLASHVKSFASRVEHRNPRGSFRKHKTAQSYATRLGRVKGVASRGGGRSHGRIESGIEGACWNGQVVLNNRSRS